MPEIRGIPFIGTRARNGYIPPSDKLLKIAQLFKVEPGGVVFHLFLRAPEGYFSLAKDIPSSFSYHLL